MNKFKLFYSKFLLNQKTITCILVGIVVIVTVCFVMGKKSSTPTTPQTSQNAEVEDSMNTTSAPIETSQNESTTSTTENKTTTEQSTTTSKTTTTLKETTTTKETTTATTTTTTQTAPKAMYGVTTIKKLDSNYYHLAMDVYYDYDSINQRLYYMQGGNESKRRVMCYDMKTSELCCVYDGEQINSANGNSDIFAYIMCINHFTGDLYVECYNRAKGKYFLYNVTKDVSMESKDLLSGTERMSFISENEIMMQSSKYQIDIFRIENGALTKRDSGYACYSTEYSRDILSTPILYKNCYYWLQYGSNNTPKWKIEKTGLLMAESTSILKESVEAVYPMNYMAVGHTTDAVYYMDKDFSIYRATLELDETANVSSLQSKPHLPDVLMITGSQIDNQTKDKLTSQVETIHYVDDDSFIVYDRGDHSFKLISKN